MVKNMPMQETEMQVQYLSLKDPLEEGITTYSSILENPMYRGAWQDIQLSDQHFINVSKLGSLCAVLC